MEEVVHVHGVAGGRVMLGHNPDIDVDHFCVHNSIPEYCKHAAQVLLNVTSKDTEKNVLRLSEIITQKCAGITDIYSYGFSFAYVDLPYITLVCSTIDTNVINKSLFILSSLSLLMSFEKSLIGCTLLTSIWLAHKAANFSKYLKHSATSYNNHSLSS